MRCAKNIWELPSVFINHHDLISTFFLDSGSLYRHQLSVFSGLGEGEQGWMWDSSLSLISPKAILGEIIWLLIYSLPKRVLNPLTLFSNSSRALLLILKNKLYYSKNLSKSPVIANQNPQHSKLFSLLLLQITILKLKW